MGVGGRKQVPGKELDKKPSPAKHSQPEESRAAAEQDSGIMEPQRRQVMVSKSHPAARSREEDSRDPSLAAGLQLEQPLQRGVWGWPRKSQTHNPCPGQRPLDKSVETDAQSVLSSLSARRAGSN